MSWIVGRATYPGVFHQKQQKPCEDHAAFFVTLENIAVSLVADGASTAFLGGRGAELAVSVGEYFLKKHLPPLKHMQESALDAIFISCTAAIRRRLIDEASDLGNSIHDFATTFMIIIAWPQGLASFHVGDGFIVRGFKETLVLCSGGDQGEYANETTFVTETDLTPSFTYHEGPVDFFVGSTDGLTRVAIDQTGQKPHPGFFEPFQNYLRENPSSVEFEEELKTFLASTPLHQRVKDDMGLVMGGFGP